MRRPVRPAHAAASVAVAAFVLVGFAGCGSSGSSDSGGSDGGSATTAAADAGGTSNDDASGGEAGEVVDCEAQIEAGIAAESMSRSTVVLFSADATSGVTLSDITPETTMTMQDDGTLAPSTLEVGVGEAFGIVPAEGASLDAVKIGCADAQTLLPGSPAGFVITQPGTYDISLEIAGTELGSVTVS